MKITILVIEDEKGIQEFLRACLEVLAGATATCMPLTED